MNDIYVGTLFSDAYLEHHGILGMKWGIKNGPPYPLGIRDHNARERKAGWFKSLSGDGRDTKKRKRKSLFTKADTVKTKSKPKPKAESKPKTEPKKKKPLTEKEKKERTRKLLIAAGVITVVAAAAYVAHHKYVQEYVGTTLKSGLDLHTVKSVTDLGILGSTGSVDSGFDRQFYAAYKGFDRLKYRGIYGSTKLSGLFAANTKVYDVTNTLTKDIKVASRKEAAKVFADLYKNDEAFRNGLSELSDKYDDAMKLAPQFKTLSKFKFGSGHSYADKELLGKGYDAFNIRMSAMQLGGDKAGTSYQKFYDALKAKGYGGIFDVNDIKYSGYRSNSPVIIFDTESVTRKAVDELSRAKITNEGSMAMLLKDADTFLAQVGIGVGAYQGVKAYKKRARANAREQR